MKFATSPLAVTLFSLTGTALGATYSRSDNVVGDGFNSFFSYEAIADPTNGFVTYVDQATAQSSGLTSSTADSFTLKADDTTVLSSGGPGRNSVRLMSTKQYTTHVAVFNMRHMPEGCGTWPAVWETDIPSWPNGGEADIVEGVNNQAANQMTLHTSSGCTMPATRDETGTVLQTDCNTAVNGNAGCGVQDTEANSYGTGFNNAGGGIYAIERTDTFIKIWFWTAGTAPSDALNGDTSVDTDSWGTPDAYFPNTSCDLASKFSANNIIINLTFCGDWAGSVFTSMGCGASCTDYVAQNPSAFSNAYFDFASINVYT